MISHVRILAAGLFCASLAACSGTSDVSGTYVQKTPTEVVMLQLVQAPDGKVSGQMAGVSLSQKGQIQDLNGALAGLVSGHNISLEMHPASILPISMQLSGSFDGGRLMLNSPAQGGVVSTFILEREKVADFQTAAAKVRDASQKIISDNGIALMQQQAASDRARIAAEKRSHATDIETILSRMDSAERGMNKADETLNILGTRYDTVDDRIKKLLDRERRLSGEAGASVMRGELSIAISQGNIATEQIHSQVQQLHQAFIDLEQKINDESARLFQICMQVPNPINNGNDVSSEDAALWAQCQRFFPARQQFVGIDEATWKRFDVLDARYASAKKLHEQVTAEGISLIN